MAYERGSEWRRWDLHIHTPETKKNDNYIGNTISEKWDKFYEDVLNYINSSDINKKVAVIGITDYFSIDNYNKILLDGKLKDKFQLILPNIEMRITPVSSESAINIHFICNPKIAPQLHDKLFTQLTYKHTNGIPYHATKEDFIKLGKLQNENISDEQARKIGLEQFVVDFSQLKNILSEDKELRDNTIVVLSNKSTDGASGVGNNNCKNANSDLTTLREDLYCFTDMLFSANPSDIDYFLGNGKFSKKEIIHKYGKLLPCIHGCDAHTNRTIFNPDQDRFCWIKADCTFEGLKQVVFEPEERVKIQPTHPSYKKDYNLIDKIIISNPNFSTEPIYFNENLTCFIGGKSTGKSIIINNMARLIDKDQFDAKCKSLFEIKGMEVYWRDGFISKENGEKRNICFIPQTYLNGLSDKPDEQTEIDKIIENIILQDEDIKEKFRTFNTQLDLAKTELDKEIIDLIKENELKLSNEQLLTENGSVEAITKEINKLQNSRDSIIKSLNINENDVKQYEKLKNNLHCLSKSIMKDKDILIYLNSFHPHYNIPECTSMESNEILQQVKQFFDNENEHLINKWQDFLTNMTEKINANIKKSEQEKNSLLVNLKTLETNIEKTETLKLIAEKIKNEENKKQKSIEIKNSLKIHSERFSNLLDNVIHYIAIFDKIHQEYAAFVNEKTNSIDDSLEFIASAQFKFTKFDEKIKTLFDNRKLKNIYISNDDGIANDIDEASIRKLIEPLFEISSISYLKNGVSIEDALRAILSNWFNIVYTIKLDNDLINAMSPGKKALVLLKLLINLAKSECPILIDQPEDDLDNRSIFDELVNFLKHKKYDRQIIIATHNANIVLGADTEEIIVANQQGNNTPNEYFRFEYRSGSIENNNKIMNNEGQIKEGLLNNKGIQEHICGILEGGKEAFNIRKVKYKLT